MGWCAIECLWNLDMVVSVCDHNTWKVEAGAQGYLWAQIEFKRGWPGLYETLPLKNEEKERRKRKKKAQWKCRAVNVSKYSC